MIMFMTCQENVKKQRAARFIEKVRDLRPKTVNNEVSTSNLINSRVFLISKIQRLDVNNSEMGYEGEARVGEEALSPLLCNRIIFCC